MQTMMQQLVAACLFVLVWQLQICCGEFYDVDGGEFTGPEVVLRKCDGSVAQQIFFPPLTTNNATIAAQPANIRFNSTMRCLSGMRDGFDHFPVNADPCVAADAIFKWNATARTIISSINGRCLQASIPVDEIVEGTPISFFQCRGTPEQQWVYNATRRTLSVVSAPGMCMSTGHRYTDFHQACSAGSKGANLPFCDSRRSIDERVADLISRLNLEEKIDQLMHSAPSIPKLSIPAYNWWSESLHGVYSHRDAADHSPSTFPAVINLGAAFDKDLYTEIGTAISDEARALHHEGTNALLSSQLGLNMFSPNINIVRDPRWGRAQETPGEDPVLSGIYGSRYVKAMQGNDPNYIKVVAVPKHYAVHSLDANPPIGDGQPYSGPEQRWQFNANASIQDIEQTYLPAFRRTVIEGGAKGMMCSYNRINGVPACANEWLLKKTLRDDWKFNGFITGDCNAVQQIYVGHKWTKTPEEAAAKALNAGVDNDCHVGDVSYRLFLKNAINQKMTTVAQVDTSVKRLFTLRFQLGMFDPIEQVPWAQISPTVVNSASHREIALRAARESMTLLKNQPVGGATLLPLKPLNGKMKIALVGPLANATDRLTSVYTGELPHVVSVEEALKSNAHLDVTTVLGLNGVKDMKTDGIEAAVAAASVADVAIVVMGMDRTVEREAVDRLTIAIPGAQLQLLQRVVAAQRNTVLVMMAGGSLDISWAKANVPAIISAGYPGEEGGTAVADVLLGVYNPSGRLPLTIYPASFVDKMPWTSHDMRAYGGKTYRFYTGETVYPFGYGLSYSTFNYQITAPAGFSVKHPANVTVRVTNSGPYAGDQSVLAFLAAVPGNTNCPLRQLADFERVSLAVGQSTTVQFSLSPLDALCVDQAGKQVNGAAVFQLSVGDATASLKVYSDAEDTAIDQTTPQTPSANVVPGQTKFYDVDGGEFVGAEVVMKPCDGSAGQRISFPFTAEKSHLKMEATGLCLSGMRDGMDQFPVNADPFCGDADRNFVWHADTQTITNSINGRCLQVNRPVDEIEEGSPITFFQCHDDDDDQKWVFNAATASLSVVSAPNMCLSTGHRYKDWQQGCLASKNSAALPFCDTSRTIEERVDDLVGRLTLDEKIDQLMHSAPSIPKLSVPMYNWWSESLHGVYGHADAADRAPTTFPAIINLGAAFDKDLYTAVGTAISDEARALHHEGANALLSTQFGLNVFSPNINIVRDPRWGRAQETPGEDPVLSGIYGSLYVKAIQGDHPKYIKVVAVPKHFAVHSLDANPPIGDGQPYSGPEQRWQFNANASAQDIAQTYLPAFHRTVTEGHAYGMMCSYNRINGVPACANPWLLQQTLRDEWKFNGFVTGDCNAIQQIYVGHKWTATPEAAAAKALEAGVDNDCHVGDVSYRLFLKKAIDQQLTSEKQVDISLKRLFTLRFKLGMFDPIDQVPWASISPTVVDSSAHRQIALRAARESIALLKNVNVNGRPLLPIKPLNGKLKIALIGPHANATDLLTSVYTGQLPKVVSIEEALKSNAHLEVTTVLGLSEVRDKSTDHLDEAAAAAAAADIAIICIGSDRHVEREAVDRLNIELPGAQLQLLKKVVAAQKNTVMVLLAGGSVDISWAKQNVPAIIHAGYPGEEGGNAVADVLLGVYNPSGRLPLTIYPASFIDNMPWSNHDMRAFGGKTYRFYTGETVYPFGYGLSYTTFNYEITAPDTFSVKQPADISVNVTNTGEHAGDLSVLAFLAAVPANLNCPLRQLADFERVSLGVGQSVIVKFTLSPLHALCFDANGTQIAGAEVFKLTIGNAEKQLRVVQPVEVPVKAEEQASGSVWYVVLLSSILFIALFVAACAVKKCCSSDRRQINEITDTEMQTKHHYDNC